MSDEVTSGQLSEVENNDSSNSESTQHPSETKPSFKVVLASNSPRRRDLLRDAGIDFVICIPSEPIDETIDADDLVMPVEAAKKLAEKKAGAVIQEILASGEKGYFTIIGADTMVVLNGEIFGKPRNLDDAKRMLRALSGKTHEVITGVSIWLLAIDEADEVSLSYRTFADKSLVTFKDLTDVQIAEYLAKGESFDKAGAYAIQGEGANLIEGYEGSLDTIIGLPVERLLAEFSEFLR